MGNFFQELKRRRVISTALYYCAGAWVILQIVDVLTPALDLPSWFLTFILYLFLIGFPVVTLLAWFYDITAGGLERDPADLGSAKRSLNRNVILLTLSVLVLAGFSSYFLVISDERYFQSYKITSIAILPFTNRNSAPGTDYLASGIHDDLISIFSNLSTVRVISRMSSNIYKSSNLSSRQIADELDVDLLMEGSVLQDGERLEIGVQLIDPSDSSVLWAENFTGSIERVRNIQSEIVLSTVRLVDADLSAVEEARLVSPTMINPESYELYLRGMFEVGKSTPEGMSSGMDYFQRAVNLNPGDAFAWLALANGYVLLGHSTAGVKESFERARAAAERASILNPELAESYEVLAGVKQYMEWDWQGAEENFKKALEINPNLAWSYYHYAWLLALTDRMDEAIAMHKKAKSLDPYFVPYTAWLGGLYLIAEDWDNAIIEAERAFELNPNDPNALWVLGDAYFALDRTEEALQIYETLAGINPDMSWQLGRAYAILGRTEEALLIALELEKDGLSPQEALGLVALWPYLGNTNRAIELLEYEDMHTWLPWTRVMGHFEPLREDPRYLEFLENTLGLPLPDKRSG